jgi:hypothetical protein
VRVSTAVGEVWLSGPCQRSALPTNGRTLSPAFTMLLMCDSGGTWGRVEAKTLTDPRSDVDKGRKERGTQEDYGVPVFSFL